MTEKIGDIENYFTNISVAVLHVTNGSVKVGDTIHIKGPTTDFEMEVKSMEIDQESVDEVKAGTKVGLKVPQRVRESDEVFK